MVTVLPALTSCSTDRLPAGSLMIKLCGIIVVTLVSVSSTGFPASTIKWFGAIRVAIERDRGSLHPVCCHRDHHEEGRTERVPLHERLSRRPMSTTRQSPICGAIA